MRKQENLKEKLRVQIPSVGAVVMSLLALILLLYIATIIVRTLASFFV